MFASYEAEFDSIVDAVKETLEEIDSEGSNAQEKRNLIQKCQVDLGQADSLVRQMNVEARSDPNAQVLKKKLASHKDNLKRVRNQFSNLQQRIERQDLFDSRQTQQGQSTGGYTLSEQARDDRERFSEVTARMDRSTDTLLDTRRVLADTEEVAMSITENLASNRSLIIGAHERVNDTGGLIGGASQILRRIQANDTKRKAMLGCLIFSLLFIIIALFVYALS
mmetsp:Transcript_8350/g.13525  ORF Transcript_8350/g.13525 Transcript_8350/m.13525 type:complete len:223 (+) Transcript_8350:542-1210(+)|eukprot:CAMPEP_0203774994 /NCGR_PEP_ID=MMETSP0099_2-20121227/5752_1 /ASSEMBLY_ACC=CAM_ASM_000209 /TAXON_ID=96639 /ORGANISM=" , Strain NY0313808BC1" /LENGTH=222 /DNA_ID=CAMNT_0050673457 /DNA_START=839 /DNA_END=1507 /DNA_ORIENTATION=+